MRLLKKHPKGYSLPFLFSLIYPEKSKEKKNGNKHYQKLRRAIKDLSPAFLKTEKKGGHLWIYPSSKLKNLSGDVDLIEDQHSKNMAQIPQQVYFKGEELVDASEITRLKSKALDLLWDPESLTDKSRGGLSLSSMLKLEGLFQNYLDEIDDLYLLFQNLNYEENHPKDEFFYLPYRTRFNSNKRRKALIARYESTWEYATAEDKGRVEKLKEAEKKVKEIYEGAQRSLGSSSPNYMKYSKYKTKK